MRNYLKLIFVLCAIIFIGFIFFKSTEQRSEENAENIKKINIGMDKENVLKLMGKPDGKEISYLNSTDSLYFYMPPIGHSEGIYIHFDSIGHVKSFIY